MIRALSLALVASSLGCATSYPHVQLARAPTEDASYEERAAYYKAHAASAYDGQRLVLHDGTAIYWPEDLAPAVDDGSPTAKAIREAQKAREDLAPLGAVQLASAGALALGTVGMTASLVPLVAMRDSELGTPLGMGLLVGGGAVMVGGAMSATLAPMFFVEPQRRFDDAIRAVVTTYPQSLSDRVGIQPDADGRLVDVAGSVEDAPAPPATAGML